MFSLFHCFCVQWIVGDVLCMLGVYHWKAFQLEAPGPTSIYPSQAPRGEDPQSTAARLLGHGRPSGAGSSDPLRVGMGTDPGGIE